MNPTTDAPLKPAGWWYGVGGALMGIGVVAAVVIFTVAFSDTIDEFQEIDRRIQEFERVSAPGEDEITLPEPGDYMVYLEGSFDSSDTLTTPEVTIESTEPDSQPLALRPVAGEFTYDLSGPPVRSAFEFTAPAAGGYLVEVGEPSGPVSGVAIGEDINIFGAVGGILLAIFVPICVGGVLILAGLIVVIVVAIRRSRAHRLRRQAHLVGPYGAPPPPPPAWPPSS